MPRASADPYHSPDCRIANASTWRFWHHAKAFHMPRARDDRFRDLFRRWFGMHLRVGHKQRAIFENHQGQCSDRAQVRRAKDLLDVVQMPEELTEGATERTLNAEPTGSVVTAVCDVS